MAAMGFIRRNIFIIVVAVLIAGLHGLAAAQTASEGARFVIGGQFAFPEEGAYVIERMQEEGGAYSTLALPQGRTLHVLDFHAYPGVRLVYAGTRVGMENATQLSVRMATLPEEYRPDVVVHSGIAGNAGPGLIGDIYLHRFFVLANLGTMYGAGFDPRLNDAYNPATGQLEQHMYFPAHPTLIELGEEAFAAYRERPAVQALVDAIRPEGEPLRLLTGYVGASSNWFVASSEVVERWQLLYGIRPRRARATITYPGEAFYPQVGASYPLGTVDMETAAAAKTFFEFGIPFAAARYPSDSARELAREEIEAYWLHAAEIGGRFVWEWILAIAAYVQDGGEFAPAQPLKSDSLWTDRGREVRRAP